MSVVEQGVLFEQVNMHHRIINNKTRCLHTKSQNYSA